MPIGTPTQKIAFQFHSDRNPPMSRPRNEPATGGERVGQDRRRRRHQHRAADALHHPPADQPDGAAAQVERIERQRDRGHGEHREAGVVDADPAEHVAEPAERHHQYGRHHEVAHQHPQQIAHVAGGQRVEPDTPEDRRQRDQHDRGVDGREQGAQGRVGQHDPLVARVVVVHLDAAAGGLGDRPTGFGQHRWRTRSEFSRHLESFRFEAKGGATLR
jgi:hypothetical protein